jgi:DNA anti-recombination protein RmuC
MAKVTLESVYDLTVTNNKSLEEKLQISNESLAEKIRKSNESLGERIDSSNAALGKRIDSVNTSLGKRIDSSNRSLSRKISKTNKTVERLASIVDRVLSVVLQTRDDVADMKPRLRTVEVRTEVAIRSLDRFVGVQKTQTAEIAANTSAINRHEQQLTA